MAEVPHLDCSATASCEISNAQNYHQTFTPIPSHFVLYET